MSHLRLLLCVCATGCAFPPGNPWTTLSATLDARWNIPEDRALADGWQKLNTGYEVRLTRAVVELEDFALQEALGSSETSFDPAHPPPGFSLCHNGHCHSDEGRLVPYAEVEGGGATSQTVRTLPVGMLDLLSEETRALECDPSCDLPLSHLNTLHTELVSALFEGEVRDGQASPRFPGTRPWRWDWHHDAPAGREVVWASQLDIVVDRNVSPEIRLPLRFQPTAALFDDVDWGNFTGTDLPPPESERVQQHFTDVSLSP